MLLSILLAYFAFFLLTCRAPYRGAEWGPQWVSRALEVAVRRTLRVFGLSSKVVFDDPDGLPTRPLQRVGCCSPHGAFPVTVLCFAMFRFRNDPALRHFRLRNAGATVLFCIPLLRELLLLLGVRDASRANLRRLLREGYSVAICPGGIWEQATCYLLLTTYYLLLTAPGRRQGHTALHYTSLHLGAGTGTQWNRHGTGTARHGTAPLRSTTAPLHCTTTPLHHCTTAALHCTVYAWPGQHACGRGEVLLPARLGFRQACDGGGGAAAAALHFRREPGALPVCLSACPPPSY